MTTNDPADAPALTGRQVPGATGTADDTPSAASDPAAEKPPLRLIVDRLEGDVAVCDAGGRMVDLPLDDLPSGARAGMTLVRDGVNEPWRVDEADTQARRERIAEKMDALFKK